MLKIVLNATERNTGPCVSFEAKHGHVREQSNHPRRTSFCRLVVGKGGSLQSGRNVKSQVSWARVIWEDEWEVKRRSLLKGPLPFSDKIG